MIKKDGMLLFQVDTARKITKEQLVQDDSYPLSYMDKIEVDAKPLQGCSWVPNGDGEPLPVSITSAVVYYKVAIEDIIAAFRKRRMHVPKQLRADLNEKKYYIFKGQST